SDSFTYTACDDHGNVSAPAEVRINIKKQTVKITYSDMDSEPSHYAALVLAEKGIYTGEQIAGCCFFRPGESVSRSEFLAMCMSVSGDELLTGVTATGFFDDSDISDWAKPYVSTALMSGSISGIRNAEGHLVFAPSEDITVSQAALMLNGVFSVSDVVSASSLDGEGELSPTAQAMENLRSCGIISDGAAALGDEPLTRAQAAMMLCSAIEKLDR
ncbi:MAG: S-layer homology domain-containing protein, partial [Oscillospiraceae bacterium]|nr:S-layer homology domain-containing protein [Oscillospiraceae bacterium]